MRIVLTKHHEEVTTVKRSVTQVHVDSGDECIEETGTPVVHRRSRITPSRRFLVQSKGSIPALTVLAGDSTDVVDLHDTPNKGSLGRAIYSMNEAMMGNPHQDRSGVETFRPTGKQHSGEA